MHPLAQSLFQVVAFAHIARLVPQIPDPTPSPVKGELINGMLPGVHLLSLVSVIDEALEAYVDEREIVWPARTRRDFFNRINVLANQVPALDAARLHQIREWRNAIAHPAGVEAHAEFGWSDLDVAIDVAVRTFLVLGFHDSAPRVDSFYERVPTLYLEELGPNGERIRHSYRVWATINGQPLLERRFEITYFPATAA